MQMYSTFLEFYFFVSHQEEQVCVSSVLKTQVRVQELLRSNPTLSCLFVCFLVCKYNWKSPANVMTIVWSPVLLYIH